MVVKQLKAYVGSFSFTKLTRRKVAVYVGIPVSILLIQFFIYTNQEFQDSGRYSAPSSSAGSLPNANPKEGVCTAERVFRGALERKSDAVPNDRIPQLHVPSATGTDPLHSALWSDTRAADRADGSAYSRPIHCAPDHKRAAIMIHLDKWTSFQDKKVPQMPLLLQYILNLKAALSEKERLDLYLNVKSAAIAQRLYAEVSTLVGLEAIITVQQENRGMDIGGFFLSLQAAELRCASYDVIVKLHAKSDVEWFKVLTENLLGSVEAASILLSHFPPLTGRPVQRGGTVLGFSSPLPREEFLRANHDLHAPRRSRTWMAWEWKQGLGVAPHRDAEYFLAHHAILQALLYRLQLRLPLRHWGFLIGTMFAVRGHALGAFLNRSSIPQLYSDLNTPHTMDPHWYKRMFHLKYLRADEAAAIQHFDAIGRARCFAPNSLATHKAPHNLADYQLEHSWERLLPMLALLHGGQALAFGPPTQDIREGAQFSVSSMVESSGNVVGAGLNEAVRGSSECLTWAPLGACLLDKGYMHDKGCTTLCHWILHNTPARLAAVTHCRRLREGPFAPAPVQEQPCARLVQAGPLRWALGAAQPLRTYERLVSPNRRFEAVLQPNGNFALYNDSSVVPMWETGTAARDVKEVRLRVEAGGALRVEVVRRGAAGGGAAAALPAPAAPASPLRAGWSTAWAAAPDWERFSGPLAHPVRAQRGPFWLALDNNGALGVQDALGTVLRLAAPPPPPVWSPYSASAPVAPNSRPRAEAVEYPDPALRPRALPPAAPAPRAADLLHPGALLATQGIRLVATYYPEAHESSDSRGIVGGEAVGARGGEAGGRRAHPEAGGAGGREGLRQHARLARQHGLSAFMFMHYWAEHARAPHRQVAEQMLGGPGAPIDMPFLLCWAAAPPPRTYGGPFQWGAHFDYLLPFFQHPQYVRVEGQPVLVLKDAAHIINSTRAASERGTKFNPQCGSDTPGGCLAADLYVKWYGRDQPINRKSAYKHFASKGREAGLSWPVVRTWGKEEKEVDEEDLQAGSEGSVLDRMVAYWQGRARAAGLQGLFVVAAPDRALHAADAPALAQPHTLRGLMQMMPLLLQHPRNKALREAAEGHCASGRGPTARPSRSAPRSPPPLCDCYFDALTDEMARTHAASFGEADAMLQRGWRVFRGVASGWEGGAGSVGSGEGCVGARSAAAYSRQLEYAVRGALADAPHPRCEADPTRGGCEGAQAYLHAYPDVAAGSPQFRADPYLHFHRHGRAEGRVWPRTKPRPPRDPWGGMVFVSAWNAWGSGAVLAPTREEGFQFLAATEDTLRRLDREVYSAAEHSAAHQEALRFTDKADEQAYMRGGLGKRSKKQPRG